VNKKMIEIAKTQELRGYVLQIAFEARPCGAGIQLIEIMLRQLKLSANKDNIINAASYLEEKGLVRIDNVKNDAKSISRSIVHITPKGIDVLEGTEEASGIQLAGD
jgi:hypothetical protein